MTMNIETLAQATTDGLTSLALVVARTPAPISLERWRGSLRWRRTDGMSGGLLRSAQIGPVVGQVGAKLFAGHSTGCGALDVSAALRRNLTNSGAPLADKCSWDADIRRELVYSAAFRVEVFVDLHAVESSGTLVSSQAHR